MKKLVDLRPVDIGQEVEADVIVTEISDVKMLVSEACFKCDSCNEEQLILQEKEKSELKRPLECSKDYGGCGKHSGQTTFTLDVMKSLCVAIQDIEVQDVQYQTSRQPVRKQVILEEELCEQVEPGDMISLRYRPMVRHKKNVNTFEIYLEGEAIDQRDKMSSSPSLSDEERKEIEELDKQDTWKLISDSIAPDIIGIDVEKRILALSLFSGLSYTNSRGTKVHDTLSVLWVGDPAIAKSKVLEYMSQVLPRGQFTVGGQATHARLVGTATQSTEGKWTIKAGKFALANGSIHCIDELGEFDRQTLGALRETMAQQTVHVDKGDQSVVMKTDEIIVAAMNPKGDRFNTDDGTPLISQIDTTRVSPALISRFDWLLFGIDQPSEDRDTEVGSAIWRKYEDTKSSPPISLDLLRKLVLLRRDINVQMDENVMEYIVNKYKDMRQRTLLKYEHGREITPRQLETVIKSLRALSRIRGRRKAKVEDAIEIMELYEQNLKSVTNGSMDVDDIFTVSSRDDRSLIQQVIETISERGGCSQSELDEDLGTDCTEMCKKLNTRGDIYFNNGKWRLV